MKIIKITIIVPVYNTEKYLERCIMSIITQNLKEIEIIIVNDGSLDNSYKIIDEFTKKDDRIKVINQKNKGLSSARNRGIRIAQGEYILHIDSDDWIEQNYLKDTYEKAKKEDLDIVITDFFLDFDNGKTEYKKDLNLLEKNYISGKEESIKIMEGESYPAVWNKLLKSELYKENNILHPEEIGLGEDLSTTPRLAFFAKKVGKINKAYVHYIQNPNSITNKNQIKKVYELILALEILRIFFKKNKFEIEIIDDAVVRHMFGLLFSIDYDYDDKYYKEAIEYFIEFHKKQAYKLKSKKNLIYSKLLNKNPTFSMFKYLYKVNKILRIIKNTLKVK